MHRTRSGLIVATLCALLTGRAAAEERVLVWAADIAGGEPYVWNPPGDATRVLGFESDLRFALAREMGRPIVFRHYVFDNLFQGLERGDFDFAMNGLEMTEERRKKVRFTRPYYVYKLGVVTRKDDDRVRSLDDAIEKGLTVGTLRGSIAEEILDDRQVAKVAYESQDQVYLNLASKNTDAVYLDTVINRAYLKKPELGSLREVGVPDEKGYYGIAVRKEDRKLAADLNAALTRLIENGELERIYRKYDLWNEDQLELRWPPSAAPVVGASIVGLMGSPPGQGPFLAAAALLTPPPLVEDEESSAEDTGHWTLGRYLPLLAAGAWMTVKLAVLSMALAVVLGLLIAVARLYGSPPLQALATLYVEFFRGIPVLLLLLFLYYAVPGMLRALGRDGRLDAFYVAVIGLGLNYAAWEAEIYRAGIGSVPAGQWEAAASLGMSGTLTFRRIILPQAIRFILPPMTSDFVALFKDTSIVSILAVVELSNVYQVVSKQSLKYLEVGLATAALYLIMSVPLGYLSRYLEKRWGHAHV